MISKGFRLFYYIKYSNPYNYQNSKYYALSLHPVHNTEPNMEMLVLCQGIVSLSSNCSAGLFVGKKWTTKTVKLMILIWFFFICPIFYSELPNSLCICLLILSSYIDLFFFFWLHHTLIFILLLVLFFPLNFELHSNFLSSVTPVNYLLTGTS